MTASGEQPGDQGIGVPHVSRVAFIAAPRAGREGGDQGEHSLRARHIAAEDPRAGDSFGHVRDAAVAPAPDLVPEAFGVTEPGESNGALAHDAMFGVRATPHGRHLDHETIWSEAHFQGRVIEVAHRATLVAGHTQAPRMPDR